MASDPQFGAYPNQNDPHGFRVEEPVRKRSFWQTCLIGCLAVLGVMVVLAVIGGFWINRHWRGWFAEFGSQALNQMIDSSDLAPQEKVGVKAQVQRVAKAFAAGEISNEQASAIVQKLMDSPLMPALVVMAVERRYFDRSKLTDAEKAEGRQSLQRFARGAYDGKIDQKGIDAVMVHVADRQPDGKWQLRQTATDEQLRAALGEAKKRADEAGIPPAPEKIDAAAEVRRIVDEALRVNAEAPQK